MADWVHGSIKIKGEPDNVRAFMDGALHTVPGIEEIKAASREEREQVYPDKETKWEGDVYIVTAPYGFHIESTYRGFVEGTATFDEAVGVLHFSEYKQAWLIEESEWEYLTEKYGVCAEVEGDSDQFQTIKLKVCEGDTVKHDIIG